MILFIGLELYMRTVQIKFFKYSLEGIVVDW
jgi:hypothetical protein